MDKSPTRTYLQMSLNNDNEDEEEEKDVEEENSFVDKPPKCPAFTELNNAMELLERYSLFSENAEMLRSNATFISREMSSQVTCKTHQLIMFNLFSELMTSIT